MYYPCSENKGADQLRGYREANLRLCFRIGKNPVFSRCGSWDIVTGLFIRCNNDRYSPVTNTQSRILHGLIHK